MVVSAEGQVTLVYDNEHRYTAPLPSNAGEAELGKAFLEHPVFGGGYGDY